MKVFINRRIMKTVYSFLLAVIMSLFFHFPVIAQSTPPVDPTPAAVSPASVIAGFPWGLVAIFVVAGFIMTYIKKNNPNKVTSSSCLPIINEAQQAREKEQIAREEAEMKNPKV
jgi:ABC-type antimicrobial peptide transport system permease subunit